MAFPQSRFAYADMAKPSPWAYCDRCGFRYLHSDLVWQFDWRGNQLANLRILVCKRTCDDKPFELNRPIIIGPDPIPVRDPRPGYQATQQGYTPVFTPLELVSDDGAGSIIPPPPVIIAGLYSDNGVLALTVLGNYPTNDLLLLPGALWSNGLVVSVTPGSTPDPSAPPVLFINATAAGLLALGGANLPIIQPPPGSGILWNAEGEVWIA